MNGEFSESTMVKAHYANDVIFGRGHAVSYWPGNVAFRHIVWAHRKKYVIALHKDKRDVGRKVLQEVKKFNGRFLINNPQTGNYHEVSTERVEAKICQALREKENKIPIGFNRQQMKNKAKWLRSIISNQSSYCSSSVLAPSSQRAAIPKSQKTQRSRRKGMDQVDGHVRPSSEYMDCNDTLCGDDISVITMYPNVHPLMPFYSDSSTSNRLVNGFDDENSVLLDLIQWTEPEDQIT